MDVEQWLWFVGGEGIVVVFVYWVFQCGFVEVDFVFQDDFGIGWNLQVVGLCVYYFYWFVDQGVYVVGFVDFFW